MNTNDNNRILLSRPCVHEDGQAAQAEQTMSCPEAHSRNCMNSPGRGLNRGLNPLIQSELPNQPDQRVIPDRIQGINELETERRVRCDSLGRKQGVNIASLNIRGRTHNGKDKWRDISTLIRKNNILVLSIQESHLNPEETAKLIEKCPKLLVENNGNFTNKEGVAFILNRDLMGNRLWKHTPLIEGRASRIQIEWEEGYGLDIINVHAPNSDAHKTAFFEQLKTELDNQEELTDPILLGDFNFVEDEMDRFPRHSDSNAVIDAFSLTRNKWKLIDSWRTHHPVFVDFTFQNTEAASRIDRIYLNPKIYPYSYSSDIINPGTFTDHLMTTVSIMKKHLPYIGKGIWRLAPSLLDNYDFMKEAEKLLKSAELHFEALQHTESTEIQKIWFATKHKIRTLAKDIQRERNHDRDGGVGHQRSQIHTVQETMRESPDNKEEKLQELNELQQELGTITSRNHLKIQRKAKTRYMNMGEKYTKYWFNLKKKQIGDQTILGLTNKKNKLVTSTREMAEIAVDHHKNLQSKPTMTRIREKAIEQIEQSITNTLSHEEKDLLTHLTSEDDVRKAIKNATNGTSPGDDGISYEFYKAIHKRKMVKKDKSKPDIIKMLTLLYQNIEKQGVHIFQSSGKRKMQFTDSLMFLMYKKNDKTKISNYRPITLLNTDYKIYTKTIAMKLGTVATTRIHVNQAGFIPKRNIYDHTNTTHMVIEYCDLVNQNGCIVALDQEKAYDKIDHDYLWRVLRKFDFPEPFIKRIQELYKNMEKRIKINETLSEWFEIKRGVHQGDPMSCILYNFAIEPLAEMIRRSELLGIEVPNTTKSLIVALFADDTLVYLNEKDNLNTLNEILDTFCKASTAKFNTEKTEYLPIGSKEYRQSVIRTKKLGNIQIEPTAKIIKEGQAMRTLGAWVGNEINTKAQWDIIVKKQQQTLDIWSSAHLSLKGKEIVLKALVQSQAIYLATVNGLPQDTERRMEKMYRNFVWDGKEKGLMEWKKAIAPKSLGGLNLPDLRSRIQAIQIMWIKKWLSPPSIKPVWAFFLDAIISQNIPKSPIIEQKARINWALQSWHESEAKDAKISTGIRQMLKVARHFNLELSAPRISNETKAKLPLWHNIGANNNYIWNKKASKCLRNNSNIITIGDLHENMRTDYAPCGHTPCANIRQNLRDTLPDLYNPLLETPRRIRQQNLEFTPNRIASQAMQLWSATFNPDIRAKGDPLDNLRIFGSAKGAKTRKYFSEPNKPMLRPTNNIQNETLNIWLESYVLWPNYENSKATTQIFFSENNNRNETYKVQGTCLSKERVNVLTLTFLLKKFQTQEITVTTSSKSILNMIKSNYATNEDNKWLDINHSKEWKQLLQVLRHRTNTTTIRIPSPEDEDDREILRKITKYLKTLSTEVPLLNLDPPIAITYAPKGAKLSTMSQSTAYKLALKSNMIHPETYRTYQNLESAKSEVLRLTNRKPSSKMIWKSIDDIALPRARDFLWKIINNKIKCGPWFNNIPGMEDRSSCKCGALETVQHIIFECDENNTTQIWQTIETLWKETTKKDFIKPNLDILVASGTLKINCKNSKPKSKLYRNLIVLTSWVIWKTRNERIFDEREVTTKESLQKLLTQITETIQSDIDWIRDQKNPKRRQTLRRDLETTWCENGIFAQSINEKIEVTLQNKIFQAPSNE
jgi:hypothetical protein